MLFFTFLTEYHTRSKSYDFGTGTWQHTGVMRVADHCFGRGSGPYMEPIPSRQVREFVTRREKKIEFP